MADSADRIGSVFAGRYTLERELGAGGMATVYLTTDHKHNRKVAVKVLRPEFAAAVGRDRFLREIEIVGHLTHPHILPLYDSGVLDELCYFVMPYVTDASSLRTRLDREGPLPIEEAIQITREIADGLAYAHANNVVHRDIKPQNIMLEAGHAVIADFGIALALDGVAADRLTGTGFSLGTPHYMSPEQASAARRLDGRTDIYSLGCVLYEMLAGHPPFTGPTLPAIMARHAVEPPPSLRIVRDTVSDSLERVCFRMLAKSPADRFQSAEELIVALTEVSYERVRKTGPARTTGGTPTTIPSPHRTADEHTGQHAQAGVTHEIRTSLPLLRIGFGIVATAMFLMVLGFLTITVHDTQLQFPPQYGPSQSNYLTTGIQALVPGALAAVAAALAAITLYYAGRLLLAALQRVPRIGAPLAALRKRTVEAVRTFKTDAQPGTVADLFLLGAIFLTGLGFVTAGPFLLALFTSNAAFLGCESGAVRWSYQPTLAVLATLLAFARFSVLRWVRKRAGDLSGVVITRYATAGLVLILLVLMVLPWRLVVARGKERVRIGDERGYIVQETADRVVIYNADRRQSFDYARTDTGAFERMGVVGYVFEEPHVFESGREKCQSVYDAYYENRGGR